ncbi:uncharacterized protein FOMMEDRAFT_137569 [Fomitiporia mediterranea MF3/22]|uniref:Uncharacterized protein n=1 Tax=Fomitiporia mediterranea (strain MF3/22) TaxID=694068 RepID=R7SG37_FOMME|nr:uncharacterized protein FOMMEDRAFT_137569 [Fomitiporia mediterranea MF3/22]EJC97681.1 hypothetical protein FOMMEDRAFT_137569 [Fomitiporia mediterranea MF3/22]
MMCSRFIGFNTSVPNCGCMSACLICFKNVCLSVSTSGVSPASSLTNVVLPIPFSPSMTMISESVNAPSSTVSLNDPSVFCRVLSRVISSAFSTILKDSCSSRKRRFSVGMKPSKKILIPSRTEYGIVTTPYIDGFP